MSNFHYLYKKSIKIAILQDGVVDFREYVTAISMLIEGTTVEKLRWSFKLYDKDKDGAITRSEMLEIMQVSVYSSENPLLAAPIWLLRFTMELKMQFVCVILDSSSRGQYILTN